MIYVGSYPLTFIIFNLWDLNLYVEFAVTGASCGYAFVEFEKDREMRRAYMVRQHVKTLF